MEAWQEVPKYLRDTAKYAGTIYDKINRAIKELKMLIRFLYQIFILQNCNHSNNAI